jgi:hypothetical protein
MMKTEAMQLTVKDVRNGCFVGGGRGWSCEVTFARAEGDLMMKVSSDEVGEYPKAGDVMWVYPPRVQQPKVTVDVVEADIRNTREVLFTLIGWLSAELGSHNVTWLLNRLEKQNGPIQP